MPVICGNSVKIESNEGNPMKSTFYLALCALMVLPAWGQNNNRGTSAQVKNSTNLTDAQRRESETYIHDGRSQRIMMQECAGLTEAESKLFQENEAKAYEQFGDKLRKGMDTCNGREDVKAAGLSPEMAGAVTKAYAMIIGMGGEAMGKLQMKDLDEVAADREAAAPAATPAAGTTTTTTTTTTTEGGTAETTTTTTETTETTTEGAKAEDEEADDTDYCRYIAMGTEVITMLQQTMAQQEINRVPLAEERNAQRASLMRVARGYEEREKNAQTQTMGWGATTGCYAAMMLRPSYDSLAWQNLLKLGSAGFLTGVFNSHRSQFKDAASKTKKIANLLPGSGDCNPHTDRDCYCSEPKTMHDPQHCAPYLHKRPIRDPGITMRTSCINNQAEADPQCKCLNNDSCVHKGIDTLFRLDGLTGQVNPVLLGDIKNLSSGTVAGSLDTVALNRNLAAARTAMKKASDEMAKLTPPNSKLNPLQMREAEVLEQFGVPKTLAMGIASSELPKGVDQKSLLASVQARFNPAAKNDSKSFNTSLKDAASSSGLRPKKNNKNQAAANPFAKFMNQGKGNKAAPAGNILHLAQQAEAQAQISNRKDSSVFDIISRRYQVSAWRRLELDQDL